MLHDDKNKGIRWNENFAAYGEDAKEAVCTKFDYEITSLNVY
jgi:hypothetical protein